MAKRVGGRSSKGDDDSQVGPAELPPDLTFESAVTQLEQIVDRLEEGDLELETALGEFERGVRLSKHCASQLDSAERRVEVLMKEGDDWIARPFEDAGDAEDTQMEQPEADE